MFAVCRFRQPQPGCSCDPATEPVFKMRPANGVYSLSRVSAVGSQADLERRDCACLLITESGLRTLGCCSVASQRTLLMICNEGKNSLVISRRILRRDRMRCARNVDPGSVRETSFQFVHDAMEEFWTSLSIRHQCGCRNATRHVAGERPAAG